VNTVLSTSFKTCSMCGFVWPERTSFLSDPTLRIIGYQAHLRELTAGLFLFSHTCGTSLSIQAKVFHDLYNGPIFAERLTGTEECRGYCLREDELRPCPAKSECAYVREVVQVILNWPKRKAAIAQPS
jgi:hypothetical protein